jgi:3-oxoacyl-[acyl-carrier protein] reductase
VPDPVTSYKLDRPAVALITGASRGLGRAIALGLADIGCDVAVNFARSADAAKEVAAEIQRRGRRAIAVQADVSSATEVDALVKRVNDELGAPAILVNNAGIGPVSPVFETGESEFDEVMAANLKSAFLVTRAVIGGMRERKWGRLIFLSSLAARVGGIISAPYAASKAGMEGLMHYYATHLLAHGVTSNAISPGIIATDMLKDAKLPPPEQMPFGRLGAPEEVAMVAQMLVANGFITGQTIQVSAGRYQT